MLMFVTLLSYYSTSFPVLSDMRQLIGESSKSSSTIQTAGPPYVVLESSPVSLVLVFIVIHA